MLQCTLILKFKIFLKHAQVPFTLFLEIYRQRLTNVHLLALVKSTIVKEQGINQVLEVLLKDIRKLETVSIIINQ